MGQGRDPDPELREEDLSVPRGPRWGRRLVLGGLLLVLVVVGSYWAWTNNSERRLAAMLGELRRQGEPVAPADLVQPALAPGQDAAPELRAAFAALDTRSADWKTFGEDVSFSEPLSPQHRELIGRLAAKEADALALVRSARDKPDADWQIQYRSPLISVLLPDLNNLRQLARLEQMAALHALLTGDHAAAVEHVRDTLALGRATDRQPMLVGHLVSLGIDALATDAVERLGPHLEVAAEGANGPVAKPATPRQVKALIVDLLDERRRHEGLSDALRGERVMQVETAIAVAERRLSLAALGGMTGAGGAGGLNALGFAPRGMLYNDARIMADYTTKVQRAAETSPDWPTFQQKRPPVPPEVTGASPFHLLARMMLPSFNLQIHYRVRLDRRMAATILAIRLYQADHNGQLPPTLEDLVPEYLPAVPVDPLAAGGQPIRYVADGERPLLYSVGENGTDEGGSDTPTTPRKVTSRWNGQDALYDLKPKPLTKEPEAADEGEGGAAESGETKPTDG